MQRFEKIRPGRELIVGVGSALVDMLAHENDAFLEKTEAAKGGMILVDKAFIENALTLTSAKPNIVPGGSACNMTVGVGKLGGKARFVGKCGSGSLARLFRQDLIKQNVEPNLFKSVSPTGRVLSIITPDAQRSMFTYLGASSEIQPDELTDGCFNSAAIVHIEGYLIFNPDLILGFLKTAKAAGAVISLDLASFTVVEEPKETRKINLSYLGAPFYRLEIISKDYLDAENILSDTIDVLENTTQQNNGSFEFLRD